MNDLSMNPPTESVNPALRDGNHYKVNFYLHNTGSENHGRRRSPRRLGVYGI